MISLRAPPPPISLSLSPVCVCVCVCVCGGGVLSADQYLSVTFSIYVILTSLNVRIVPTLQLHTALHNQLQNRTLSTQLVSWTSEQL
jgi:hypothetical protein